jgi:hypothetical protein
MGAFKITRRPYYSCAITAIDQRTRASVVYGHKRSKECDCIRCEGAAVLPQTRPQYQHRRTKNELELGAQCHRSPCLLYLRFLCFAALLCVLYVVLCFASPIKTRNPCFAAPSKQDSRCAAGVRCAWAWDGGELPAHLYRPTLLYAPTPTPPRPQPLPPATPPSRARGMCGQCVPKTFASDF